MRFFEGAKVISHIYHIRLSMIKELIEEPKTTMLKTICRHIDLATVVSFDVFDTLLMRPYLRATDLFRHLEAVYDRPRFAARRIEAEREARSQHPEREDITLDMIYEEIDEEFREMKGQEPEWEQMVLRANPEMKIAYDYAVKCGKRIIISSDMYLPSEIIARCLKNSGYSEWERLYVSSELNATKSSGSMYRLLLAECGVRACDVLHIGDHKHSDYRVPRKLGMRAIAYTAPCRQFLAAHPRYELLFRHNHLSVGVSILLGLYAWNWMKRRYGQKKDDNYWHDIGYYHAGPLAYGLARFVESEARAHCLDKILFVARDGYLLRKIYSTFASPLPHAYIYAPRILSQVCLMNFQRSDEFFVRSVVGHISCGDPSVAKEYADFDGNAYDFYREHGDELKQAAQRHERKYAAYIRARVKPNEKCALVDTVTLNYSAQRLLEKALHEKVYGIYWWHADRYSAVRRQCSFFSEKKKVNDGNTRPKMWNYVEFLLSSPEHPIKGINECGEPVFSSEQSPHELKRAGLYIDIERGALKFANDVGKIFKGNDIFLTAADLSSWLDIHIDYPTRRDMEQMRGVCFPGDSGHNEWEPLFLSEVGVRQFLRTPRRALLTIKKTIWRSLSQKILLSLCSPFALGRDRNKRRLTFYLFPYLQRRYFCATLQRRKHWSIRFIIGDATFWLW